MLKLSTQAEWTERARAVLPGGGFGNFDPGLVIARGEGARVWDADGTEYVDLLIGSGPMLLGHSHPEVMEAILEALPLGQTFFATNPHGIALAEAICEAVPCCEQIRYVASGGEADMYAIRLARAATGREAIVKFEGGYHGMSPEAQMSLAPSIHANFPTPVPDSAGIPASVADHVLVAPFNDLAAVEAILAEQEVAAVIVEPLQRVVPAETGFLAGLRALCDRHGALLIFDEIVTGFRLDYGGAQERYGVIPDICTLGKAIGGGFALAAVGASRDLMRHFDKAEAGKRWLMQLGTLSGAPIAAAAGLKTLEVLRRSGTYDRLRETGAALQRALAAPLKARGIPHRIVGDATLFDVYLTDRPVRDYRSAHHDDPEAPLRWNAALRTGGVLKSPSKAYPSLALVDMDLSRVTDAAERAALSVPLEPPI
ncbi:MAG: aspartate aminotransferase family protein [Paracoccaceae bacterium]